MCSGWEQRIQARAGNYGKFLKITSWCCLRIENWLRIDFGWSPSISHCGRYQCKHYRFGSLSSLGYPVATYISRRRTIGIRAYPSATAMRSIPLPSHTIAVYPIIVQQCTRPYSSTIREKISFDSRGTTSDSSRRKAKAWSHRKPNPDLSKETESD